MPPKVRAVVSEGRGARRHRIAGEELARRRLARVLHDDHGQRVAAFGFELKAVRRLLPEDDPSRSRLDSLARQLTELGQDLRRLSHAVHPVLLDHRGLEAALRAIGAEAEERHGLAVELDLLGPLDRLPREVTLALYRIVQEGLSNAGLHARARTVRLRLEVTGSLVRLGLKDDGKGFDAEAARRTGGLGIASMEERARLLGGRCQISSAPGAGTAIEVSLPRHRLGRWLRRRRRWILAVALIVLTLGGGFAATFVQARQAAVEARRAEATVHFLEGLFTSADPRSARGRIPDARELLRRGSERLESELEGQSFVRARLLATLGGIHTELGLYDEARPLLEEALALSRKLEGAHHSEIAAILIRLGALAHHSGQGDALAYFREAQSILEKSGHGDSPEAADLLNKLGAALGARGRFDEAEAMLRQSLALHERLFGADDLRVAKILHNLSGIAYYRKDYPAAEPLILRALTIRQAALPRDDPELAGSREVLALLRRDQGRLEEAAVLLEELAAGTERVYGPDHPHLARTLLNLGLVRADLGEGPAARGLLERAVSITRQALAPDHPQRIRALAALAEHHWKQGGKAEAEPLLRELLTLRDQGAAFEGWERVAARWDELKAAQGQPLTETGP